LHAELRRVLKPSALFCLRCFARPDRLGIDTVLGDLRAGRFADPFIFRWLFLTAVQGDAPGVLLDDVWRAWQGVASTVRAEIDRLGWREDIDWAFGRYRGGTQRYIYFRRDELTALVAPHFELLEYRVPAYERGECFPSLVMRPRA
jgi:SAM-dependent methyltransferase